MNSMMSAVPPNPNQQFSTSSMNIGPYNFGPIPSTSSGEFKMK